MRVYPWENRESFGIAQDDPDYIPEPDKEDAIWAWAMLAHWNSDGTTWSQLHDRFGLWSYVHVDWSCTEEEPLDTSNTFSGDVRTMPVNWFMI